MVTAHSATAPTLIGSVQRALRLLEAVADHADGAPAKQLAREAGLPLSTAYHLLRTLAHEGYLRREQGVFVLGEAAVRLAGTGVRHHRRGMITDCLELWRDAIGVPVYFALYRDGEIELVAVAEGPSSPAVEEWADFRETGHAHALGQCLLSQLDEESRRDHLSRHPVGPLTPNSVPDRRILLERLAAAERQRPVVEREEYAVGSVCAALPLRVGSTVASMAISLPVEEEHRLLPAVDRLRRAVDGLPTSLMFSISI